MNKKKSPKKDYIDEYKDWQDNQYNPGHFTGGRTPIWLSRPGNPKALGIIFFVFGLGYSAWMVYEIIELLSIEPTFGEIASVIFLSIPSMLLLAGGVVLIQKRRD